MTINKTSEDTTNNQEDNIGKSAEHYRNQIFPTLMLEDFEKQDSARRKLFEGGNAGLRNAIRPNMPEQA